MSFVEVEGGRLYYDLKGKGPWLVLIHGAWASREWWRWLVPELSRHYRVLAPDVRGHGLSSPLESPYSVQGFARDLDVLFQEVGLEEAALVGWSMGGLISMQYCLDYPSKVKALVLLATRGHRNRLMKARVLVQYFRVILGLMMDLSAPRKYDRTGAAFAAEQSIWLEREARKMLSPTAPREVFDWVVSDLAHNPRKNYIQVAGSIWNWEAGPALREIRAPTLVMVGEHDRLTPPRFSRLLDEEIPDSKLVVFPGAGHYVALERPEAVNSEIINFLSGLGYK